MQSVGPFDVWSNAALIYVVAMCSDTIADNCRLQPFLLTYMGALCSWYRGMGQFMSALCGWNEPAVVATYECAL